MYPFGGRRRRGEDGATTAEYVGILAFAALLAIAVIGFTTPISGQSKQIMSSAFCKIGATLGGAGCSNSELPTYVPTDCTVSSNGKQYGGSVSVVATVGGDSGYTLLKIRERQDDGSFKDTYVVRTSGEVNASYEFGPKAGADVKTGSGGVDANKGASVNISGNISTGSNFQFDSLEEAREFAEKNKDNFGGAVGGVEGGPEAESTYYQAGGGVDVSGDAGPLKGSGGGKAVLGVETYKNGDTKFTMALTLEAAAELGIPVPSDMIAANAAGNMSLSVTTDLTFDKDGKLVKMAGEIAGQAKGSANVKLGAGQSKPEPGETKDVFDLPSLTVGAGGKVTLGFSTTFDDEGRSQLSEAVGDFVTGGGIGEDAKAAITDQLANHSQYTFTQGTVNEERDEWGGKVKVIAVTVGAEGHVVTTDETTTGGWYYNPVTGTWEENLACSG